MPNKKFLLLIVVILIIGACSNKKVNKPDSKEMLASALHNKIFSEVGLLLTQIRVTENTHNLIDLFLDIHSENLWVIDQKVEYIKQFLPNMRKTHQAILNKIMIWLYVNQVYRHEVSPPIRIIQREELFLEPSKVDFRKCPNIDANCAHEVRKKLLPMIDDEELTLMLKRMALKDPCVNSSTQLQGQTIANRCLNKSKGHLKIILLALPRFSVGQWLQVISAEN